MDSLTSTIVPLGTLSGDITSCPSVNPRASQLIEEGHSSVFTTVSIEFSACHCCDPSDGDRGFFFFVPFLSFAGEDYVSYLVPALPNALAPRSVSSRAATFLT